MTRKAVNFFSDGIRLSGIVQYPEDYAEGQQRAAVLVCHGRVAIKEWVPSRWTPYFLARGYICMSFDYRNLGESEGRLGTIIPQEEVRDVMHAVTFLQQQPGVDAERIGILGWGLGGGVVVSAAARDTRLKAVVCASGVANGAKYGRVGMTDAEWADRQAQIRRDRIARVLTGKSATLSREELVGENGRLHGVQQRQGWKDSLVAAVGIERASDPVKLGIPDRITLESLDALYEFTPEDDVDRIAPRPLLVIHSEEDDAFPFDQVKAMYDRARPPKDLIVVRGAGHLDWIDPAFASQKRYVPQVIDWMVAHLSPASSW